MKKLFQFINICTKSKKTLIVLLILQLFLSILSLSSSEVLRMTIKAIEDNNFDILKYIVIFAILLSIFYIITDYNTRVLHQKIMNDWQTNIQTDLLGKVYQLKKQKFKNYSTGEIITKSITNTETAVNGTAFSMFNMVNGILGISVAVIYMGYYSPILMIMMVVWSVIFRIVSKKYDNQIKGRSKRNVSIENRNSSFIFELLNMTAIIKIFNKREFFKKQLINKEEESMDNRVKLFAWNFSYMELRWCVNKILELVILYGFGAWLISRGEASFSVIIALTLANDYFSKSMNFLQSGINEKNKTIPNIDTVISFLDETDIEDEKGKLDLKNELTIEFRDVSFSYGETSVLEGVSFTIKQGEWVQIKGPNGHGKSTLLNLLLGLYRPNSGKVLYGGEDTTTISLDNIAEHYSYISQNSHVLLGSVYDNITLRKQSELSSYDEIIKHLNLTKVKDSDCNKLSQGERQRLGIGRALYQIPNTPLVIGDEIFANIDKDNSKQIIKEISKACKGKTIFFVCHEEMGLPFDKTLIVENKQVSVEKEGVLI